MNLDLKLTLFVVLSSAYFGGYMKVNGKSPNFLILYWAAEMWLLLLVLVN